MGDLRESQPIGGAFKASPNCPSKWSCEVSEWCGGMCHKASAEPAEADVAPYVPTDSNLGMNVVYALQELPKVIFLAGPTPRSQDVPSWRPRALAILNQHRFAGTVLVPEQPDWASHDNYDGQIEWEWAGLDRASAIVFWVPRDLVDMPAFTTNVEFGLSVASGKAILGFPAGSPKTKYLEALARRYNTPVFHDLEELLMAAMKRT